MQEASTPGPMYQVALGSIRCESCEVLQMTLRDLCRYCFYYSNRGSCQCSTEHKNAIEPRKKSPLSAAPF